MSSNFSNVQEDLLVKYLLGEATDTERHEVDKWINDSKENKKYYEHFALIWDASKEVEAKSNVNVEDAWSRFRERTASAESGDRKVIALPNRMNWVRAAAVLVLLTGAGWLVYTLGIGVGEMVVVNSGNSVLAQTLPDGSVITLNKNSSLKYNSKFKNERSVKLEGEGFFNVAPDKKHPFVIDVQDTRVTVVGTSFNIKSDELKTEVIVESGIVDVSKNQKYVRLNPNEKATVLATGDEPIKQNSNDELYNYYRTKQFVCDNTPLPRLVEVLNEAYGVEIVIENDRLEYQRITTTFSNHSLDEILDVLEKQYNIQADKNGTRITLE
jgi:transmembrane sensor